MILCGKLYGTFISVFLLKVRHKQFYQILCRKSLTDFVELLCIL